jgi:hypothetical protein
MLLTYLDTFFRQFLRRPKANAFGIRYDLDVFKATEVIMLL